MFAFFSLLFYASSLLPFFPFFLSFLPPTYLPSTHTIPYHARFTPYYAMLYYCILCNIIRTYLCPIYIHDLGFVLHSLLLFAHTLSIFISLSLVTVTLSIYTYDYEQAGSHRHLARRDLTAEAATQQPAKDVLIARQVSHIASPHP